mmetsp:Transcript_23318/g.50507  ORF Transcript_23318/g.50507 Transcript_23318/m.50507 type:complete len:87 (-) Transcript_23318:118-378(-)
MVTKIENQVKGLLNEMTMENFDKLSAQMCEIPIFSYEVLTTMVELVYEKATSELSYSNISMYANLCYRLNQATKKSTFTHIIESDE